MKILPETIARIKLTIDPESVINHLGFHIVRRTPKELRGPCKVHGGDNPTGFRFNLETRTWCCYTHHCEGDQDRDLVGLVQKTTGLGFQESVKFLADIAGINLDKQDEVSEDYLRLKQQREMEKEIRQSRKGPHTETDFPEEIIQEMMGKRSEYFVERGFPVDLLDFFQVGGMMDRSGIQRETIPIRDENGKLLSVSARRTDGDIDPKYLLLKNVPKGITLYNLDVAKDYVGLPRTLILVEGFVDVWALAMQGIWNTVAAMGTDLTGEQVRLVQKYADEVILMLDPDEAGQKAMDRVEKALEFYVAVRPIRLPPGKDPKNFTYQDVKHYFGRFIKNG